MKRILITGGTGYLGSVLVRQARDRGDVVAATSFTRPPVLAGVEWLALDVRDPAAIGAMLDKFGPDLVIHTAFRQHGPDLFATTATGAGNVAQATAARGIRLIHMSSDALFDGETSGVYTEEDPPSPITPYGEAKAAAEALVAAAHPAATIVRTSLIYGFDPPDMHTRFALDVAAGQRVEALFRDELRCPIYVEDLAAALLELGDRTYAGVLHIAGAETVSRYALGRMLVAVHGADPEAIPSALSAEQPVRRPRNCAMSIARAQALLGTPLRGVSDVLRAKG
jgi:dTDP-4-dehydrorhamnose reductase